MANRFFNNIIDLFSGSKAKASDIEAHFTLITTGFDGVQTEMDLKAPVDSPIFTSAATLPAATTIGTVSAAELLTLDGVTSAIQAQIDAKAPLASPTLTGTPAAPTATPGANSTQIATTAYADAIGAAMIAAGAAADADAIATAADRVQTGLDRTQTGLDRVQTGADRTAAAQSLVDIAALYDTFDDRYLGVKATDPTLDNDGNALVAGAIYVNSTSGFLRAYTVSGWVQGLSTDAGVTSVNGMTGVVTGIADLASVQPLTNKTLGSGTVFTSTALAQIQAAALSF